jgi:hypothetical protein
LPQPIACAAPATKMCRQSSHIWHLPDLQT